MRLLSARVRHRAAARPLSRFSDVALAASVVGVIAMMILPLPTLLVDVLITLNISVAVILLLVSIYVDGALSFSAFPSVLLLTTLFRLGLNVSSTRLILLQADAGQVISSFGSFVVGRNLVVGVVIFLILTCIQYIVIARGSERVAEVAARFTLDALPGRQMAIDADIRSGGMDRQEAGRQRAALQRESQLYGAMDGAMKFVKGDAIAAIIITIINIVGGLLIGLLQRGLDLAEAVSVYSLLTIGDGLVSQIPALLISTAAGILVTRVSSQEAGDHLGLDIGRQVRSHPRAMVLAAGLLALLALAPGLPAVPFLLLAAVVGLVASRLLRERRSQALDAARQAGRPPAPHPLELELGHGLLQLADPASREGLLLREIIAGLRDLLLRELGVPLGEVAIRAGDPELGPQEYCILLFGEQAARGRVAENQLLVAASPELMRQAGVTFAEGPPRPDLGLDLPLLRVAAGAGQDAKRAGATILDRPTLLALHLGQLVRTHAAELVGIQETRDLLDGLARTHPALVHEVVPRIVPLKTVAEVLSRLLSEGVSVRDLRGILGVLARFGPVVRDAGRLAEHVRRYLCRNICQALAGPDSTLCALVLDPSLEEAVRGSLHTDAQADPSASGPVLVADPDLGRDLVQAVEQVLRELVSTDREPWPVLLTSAEVRRHVRDLLQPYLPRLVVLSHEELAPGFRVQKLGRITGGQGL